MIDHDQNARKEIGTIANSFRMTESDRAHVQEVLSLVKDDSQNWYASYRLYVGIELN